VAKSHNVSAYFNMAQKKRFKRGLDVTRPVETTWNQQGAAVACGRAPCGSRGVGITDGRRGEDGVPGGVSRRGRARAATTSKSEVGVYGHSMGNEAHEIDARIAQDWPFAYGGSGALPAEVG
jgi:hypothetical protein